MKPKLDSKYWTERYQNNDAGWDAGTITEPIKVYVDGIKNKNLRILIPGAGNAHEAEYLVKQGFTQVYVCDLSSLPLENLKKRCPEIPNDHLILANFFDLEGQTFDLIIEQTFFCAIDPSLRKKYFQKTSSLLSPKGKLAGVLFNDVLNADHPPFGGNEAEYLQYIPQDLEILHMDPCYNSIGPRKDRELFIELLKK